MYTITDVNGWFSIKEYTNETANFFLNTFFDCDVIFNKVINDLILATPNIVVKNREYDIYRLFSEMLTVYEPSVNELLATITKLSSKEIIFISKIHELTPNRYRMTYYAESNLLNDSFSIVERRKIRIDTLLKQLK